MTGEVYNVFEVNLSLHGEKWTIFRRYRFDMVWHSIFQCCNNVLYAKFRKKEFISMWAETFIAVSPLNESEPSHISVNKIDG